MADIKIPFPQNIDPDHRQVPMEDPVQLPNGEYEQVQKFNIQDSEPVAIKVTATGQTVEQLINALPPHMMDFLHWGNLSKAGVQFSDEFISRHADRLDWNMISLFAPLSPTAAAAHKSRLVPHMLMKNPNLNDAVLSVVADRLDLDRVVKELKISSDFARKNIDVLSLDDLIKYQKLSDGFWIEVLRSYQTSPVKLVDLATRIVETQNLGMEFVNGIQAITTEVNEYLKKCPIPNVSLPLRVIDGASLIRRTKMDHTFIANLLSYPNYPEERKKEIKQQMVAFQDLSAGIVQQFYSGDADLANEELCYQILSRQPVSPAYLNSQGNRILTIPRFRIAVATRQLLSGPQIESLLAAADVAQREILATILVTRNLREPSDPLNPQLTVDVSGDPKLYDMANWATISSTKLNPAQAKNALLCNPGRIHWREFINTNRQSISESDIELADRSGALGPLEWVLILTAEDKNKKLVRLTPANSMGLYSADFLSKHQSRFDWWKYIIDPTKIPQAMMNKSIVSSLNPTETGLAHLRKQCDAILQVFVTTADWDQLLRYEELPLWFIDGMKKYSNRPELNRNNVSFWWKVSVYQPLYKNPKFITDHTELLEILMVTKYQLHKMYTNGTTGPATAVAFLRQFSDFFDDDTMEFVMKNRDLAPLMQMVQAEKTALNPSNPVPEIAAASVAWPGMEISHRIPDMHEANTLPVVDVPKPMYD